MFSLRKKTLFALVILVISIVSAACSNASEEKTGQVNKNHQKQEHHTHDVREETANNQTLPEFLNEKPETMKTIYAAAAENKELLENIPCYCGCGESAGHKDNYDCFVNENKENGRVVWDDHGTKCGVCLEIAAQSISDLENGKSIKEIRQNIDAAYKEGYAKPTPTPKI
ncbi:hypothetical protein FZC66_07060 [Priestia megaterium]|nr:hypothetical protein FZC66_07060 [Priestia megaterium]